MENAAKIVKERLKSAARAVDHPDADVLTAFTERTLGARERSHVLEHLAHCAECREVVVLAMPAEEPDLAVILPVRGGWLTWPRLRWGLVAAGVIVVGWFGVLRYERAQDPGPVAFQSARTDGQEKEAKSQPDYLVAPSGEVPERKPISRPPAESSDVKTKPQTEETKKDSGAINFLAKSEAPRDETTATGNRTILHRQTLAHGPMPPTQWQQNLNANSANQPMMFPQAPAPAPHAPAAKEPTAAGIVVSAQSPPSPAPPVAGPTPSEKPTQDLDTLAVRERPVAALPATRGSNGTEVARAKDAEPPANAPEARAVGAYAVAETSTSNFSASGSLVPESARWAINAAGGLQRSFDQGKTWQAIDVNSGAQDSTAAVNLQLAKKSSLAKAGAKGKSDAKAKPIVFRAVAANGPDVWVGGSEATLFHSLDSGDHWIRIQPSWRGAQLNGDILSLQFADPQHGRIVTSTAEIWTTADAGQSWDKQ